MVKLCVASTVRAPLNETLMFINYHLNIGIDEIVIFFDDPSDAAIAHLDKLDRVTCIRCDEQYWRSFGYEGLPPFEERLVTNANAGVEIARDKGCQWVILIDNDELVYPIGDLKEILSNCRADVLRFTVNEAVSEKENYENIFSPTLFKKPARYRKTLSMILGCRRAYFFGEYFRGHLASKAAYRTSSNIKLEDTHGPRTSGHGLVVQRTPNVLLLHFDCVGLDAWKSKWLGRIKGAAIGSSMRGNRKKQLEFFAEAFAGGDEKIRELYKRLHTIPRRVRLVLMLLGMLGTVKVDSKLFLPPNK